MPHVRPIETVESALRASDAGVRDADNAALHGVAVKTIRRWRREYQRRGKARGQLHLAPPCPRCDEGSLHPAAYSELLGWYLRSADIRDLCCWALDLVDVPWRQSNAWTISVSTRVGVARLDDLIGLKR